MHDWALFPKVPCGSLISMDFDRVFSNTYPYMTLVSSCLRPVETFVAAKLGQGGILVEHGLGNIFVASVKPPSFVQYMQQALVDPDFWR